MALEIRTAAEIRDLALPRSWTERTERRDARQDPVLHQVWQQFVERDGPVAIDAVERSVPGRRPGEVRAALTTLDEADLLVIEGEVIRVAYPFTTGPNVFAVDLAPGVTRYTCCALDALGLAPMLGQAITIRSRCHHCEEPLVIDVDAQGPRSLPDAMMWVAPRDVCAARITSGL